MSVTKLFFLPTGSCYLDQSAVNRTLPAGKLVEMPVWSFLLETTDGPILIDTGMPDSFVNNPNYYKGTKREGRVVPNMSEDDRIINVLKRVGYRLDDIQALISSHLHLDHAGGNGHFHKAPIFVQQAELDAAIGNNDYAPQECIFPDLPYHAIEGDYEVRPGIQILFTPGHSPGHQSILVKTKKSGYVLLTVDVAYVRQNFDNGVPFLTSDPEMATKSIQRMKEVIQEFRPSTVFFGHDQDQAKNCRTFPDYL